MALGRRLEPQEGNPFERGEPVQFQFEGRPLQGYDNEPLAVALLAAGVGIFGRSTKYRRPRGPVCLRGHCSGCLMRVNGVPNVRTCETPCRSGMVVERQTGWPSAGLDLFRAVDLLSGERLDHHGTFTASSVLNRLAGGVVRRLSGLGEPPSADPKKPVPVSRFQADAVVIGAGAAGLAAGRALGECGHNVVLLETEEHRGGQLLDITTPDGFMRVKERIDDEHIIGTREWLAKNVKGLGFKEASHFLRNIGFGQDVAILDRHILNNLKRLGVIDIIPKSLTPKRYSEIEERMAKFSKAMGIPLEELDLLFWSEETGHVFK